MIFMAQTTREEIDKIVEEATKNSLLVKGIEALFNLRRKKE